MLVFTSLKYNLFIRKYTVQITYSLLFIYLYHAGACIYFSYTPLRHCQTLYKRAICLMSIGLLMLIYVAINN